MNSLKFDPMKKIPLLGTQTLNSLSNLKKLIQSIDYPVEIMSIIVNNENFEILVDIKKFCDSEINPLIEKYDISWHPTNLGCSSSWNYHFKQYPYADFFIKPDDDIEFAKGDLKRIVETLDNGFGLVFYSDKTKYACFGITKETLKQVGMFDENIYPACYEDDDYEVRSKLIGINQICLHQISSHISSGSSRNLKDKEGEHKKLQTFLKKNEEYFFKKWGNRYPDNYENPFNNKCNSIKDITYDFDYRESKVFRCNYTK